ncbi:hypothetical protein Pcinc_009236 [Petrolisthes cinctipes]|uniref:Uncharacterized protein n=1 Tax=Petrolisthes cinctipes TaxID=88211 RepID=A0AAE1G504_PETCI|nr:hypothetical protein Pcinc_009236 [Petrolisthes cinctipes]
MLRLPTSQPLGLWLECKTLTLDKEMHLQNVQRRVCQRQLQQGGENVDTANINNIPLPYCWRDDIKKQLDEFRVKDMFAPINYPTDWCHPMVLVSKKDAGIIMRVDLTKLNKYI